jgi:hypothetical protein
LDGIDYPWLCWNVDPDWCIVQQRLVRSVGWTPLVGSDPRLPRPALLPESVFIDFNEGFGVPTMWMHFPLEFTFAFAPRLAFWHSDLLIREDKMRHLSDLFRALEDGSMAAVVPQRGWSSLLQPRRRRYWELVGCTTRGASRSQFEHGCGWWCNFFAHPNCPSDAERTIRRKYYWDHGVGIYYWKKRYGGRVVEIDEAYVAEGHCTGIGKKDYRRVSPNDARRFLTEDLRANYELAAVCEQLGLSSFHSQPPGF